MELEQRYLFDRTFDSPLAAAAVDEAREEEEFAIDTPCEETPVETFSEEDLARARAEGLAEGREQANVEATTTTERRIADTLDAIHSRLAELIDHQQEATERSTREAIRVASAVAEKMLPDLYRRNALGEIEQTVATILEHTNEQPNLKIRVNESLSGALSERLASLIDARGIVGRLEVAADPQMTEGDCRLEWPGGVAERNFAAMRDEIDAIVMRHLDTCPMESTDDRNHREMSEVPAVAENDTAPPHDDLGDNHV